MNRSVFNCTNDDLTIAAFCLLSVRKGQMAYLNNKDCAPEPVNMKEFMPHLVQGETVLEPKDRVVFTWEGGDTFKMYAFAPYDILSEARLELKLRSTKGYLAIFKGLRDINDNIHFYRKTEYDHRPLSRYFGSPTILGT